MSEGHLYTGEVATGKKRKTPQDTDMLKALAEAEKASDKDCKLLIEEPNEESADSAVEKFHKDRKELTEKINANPAMLLNEEIESVLSLFREEGPRKLIERIRSILSDPISAGRNDIDHKSETEIEDLRSKLAGISSMKSPKDLPGDYYEAAMDGLQPEAWKSWASSLMENNLRLMRNNLAFQQANQQVFQLAMSVQEAHLGHLKILWLLKSLRKLTQAENMVDTEAAQKSSKVRKEIASGLKKTRVAENNPLRVIDETTEVLEGQRDFPDDSHFGHEKIMNSRPESRRLLLLSKVYNGALQRATFLERVDAKKDRESEDVEESLDTENRSPSTTNSDQDPGKPAKELRPKDLTAYKKHVQDTIEFLEKTFNECNKQLQPSTSDVEVGKMVEMEMEKRTNPLYFPGPRSQECDGVQPVFEWLLGKVGSSLSEELGPIHHRTSEPEEVCPRKDKTGLEAAIVSNNTNDHIRYGDFTCVKDGRHIWVYRDDYMPFIVEVKPLWRTDKNWSQVMDNAIQQTLAHTSKFVTMGALAGGVGANSHASAAIGSLAYIRFCRLKLTGMETGHPELVLERTKLLPLMTRENCKKYCKANPRSPTQNKSEGLEDKLYDEPCSSDTSILPGFLAMSQIVTASSSDLFGHPLASYADEAEGTPKLGQVLGFGTFANVYSINNQDTVAKISRFGRQESLKAEAEILKQLKQKEPGCEHLCQFVKAGEVELSVRGYTRPYYQIITSPRCQKGALEHIHEEKTEIGQRAWRVFKETQTALTFLHKRNFVHNDVSSKNIMVKNGKVVLIDLSLASRIGEAAFAGQGNLQTMHRACHCACGPPVSKDGCRIWYPEGLHDKVSLAYAIVIMCQGSVPWPKLQAGSSNNKAEAFSQRQKKATEVVTQKFFSKEEQKTLTELIEKDTCAYYRAGKSPTKPTPCID